MARKRQLNQNYYFLNNIVRNGVRTKRTDRQIIERVRDDYPFVQPATIAAYASYWREARDNKTRFLLSGGQRQLNSILETNQYGGNNFATISFNFEFRNPKTKEIQKAGWSIDVSQKSTVSEAKGRVMKSIKDWLSSQYNLRNMRGRQLREIEESITFLWLEGK